MTTVSPLEKTAPGKMPTAHDKIVRSTHGVNCTGSCSWKIYVKGGIVTWETQQTDYPRTRWDMPNHEPRGCARGASYSWYLYSANRVKYPLVRGRLLERWRAALKVSKTPVDAWALIQQNPEARRDYQQVRGMGGFVRSSWDEVNQLIAAATDPGHEHGELCRRQPLPVTDRWGVHELLRLVLRPATGQSADLG